MEMLYLQKTVKIAKKIEAYDIVYLFLNKLLKIGNKKAIE